MTFVKIEKGYFEVLQNGYPVGYVKKIKDKWRAIAIGNVIVADNMDTRNSAASFLVD